MNIVIIRPNTSDFGKIGTYNVQEVGLAKSLIKKGYNVVVLFTHRNVKSITKDETYDFVYYIPRKRIGLHGIFSLKFLAEFKPNYIIMFADNQFWAKNIINWCKKNKITCVNYFGGVLSNNPKWLNQFYTRLILFRNKSSYKYSINIAKTTAVKKEMDENGIICEKVINIGLDKDLLANKKAIDYEMREELSFSENDKIVLFIGRLVDYKKPIFACQIIKELHKMDSSYRLIIIGSGYLENHVLNFIIENNLQDIISFVGRISYDQIYKYMIISNCIINLSEIEIFGMTIIEGMYYGNVVVAHNAPGPNDIVSSGVNGYLIDTYDLVEWINLIDYAIKNRYKVVKNSVLTVENKFTWDAIGDQFLF